MQGTSLGDLVQMECLAGVTRVLHVTSSGNHGYLYLRAGAVVHAVTRSATGEAAALEMLAWHEGSFELIEREWPATDSISSSWQSLLLRAAQVHDERQAQRVVALRDDGRAKAGRPQAETMELVATPVEIGGHVFRNEDFDMHLRLSASGATLHNHGGTQDFADAVAFGQRLADLVGEMLGLDRVVAMECAFKKSRCFVVRSAADDIDAFRLKPSTDSASLRELFGI